MKLVLLEILIVAVATRAILALIGRSPGWPNPLWECFALVAAVATAALIYDEMRKRLAGRAKPARPLAPPAIPLDRIGPFTHEQLLVRFGATGPRDIHLN